MLVSARYDAGASFGVVGQEPLFAVPGPGSHQGAGLNTIDVSPDGERFLMGRPPEVDSDEAAVPRLTLVTNFTRELEERVRR
jgi:hypothetical protein